LPMRRSAATSRGRPCSTASRRDEVSALGNTVS
jgi:hypothetical protein